MLEEEERRGQHLTLATSFSYFVFYRMYAISKSAATIDVEEGQWYKKPNSQIECRLASAGWLPHALRRSKFIGDPSGTVGGR